MILGLIIAITIFGLVAVMLVADTNKQTSRHAVRAYTADEEHQFDVIWRSHHGR